MSTAGQKFPVTFQGVFRFFLGTSKYFTFSTISRRTPHDVLQDSKVQRNPGNTGVRCLYVIWTWKSVRRPHYLSSVPSSLFQPGTTRTGMNPGDKFFFRASQARVDSLQIFTLNRKDKTISHPGTWAWS